MMEFTDIVVQIVLQVQSWIFFSVCVCVLNHSASAAPWTVAHQAPLLMEFSRQEKVYVNFIIYFNNL